MRQSKGIRYAALVAVALAIALGLGVERVAAFTPTGACCLPSGTCQEVIAMQCETSGGEFIGDSTSCSMIDCEAPLAVPMMSIVGFVALVGALFGLAAYRLMTLRPRHALSAPSRVSTD